MWPSLVRRLLWEQEIAGSNPVTPTNQQGATIMSKTEVLGGTVHDIPLDLQASISASENVLDLWQNNTPLGRNEFICWVEEAKKPETREKRIRRTVEQLLEGKKRPCCWPGCAHRVRNGK